MIFIVINELNYFGLKLNYNYYFKIYYLYLYYYLLLNND